MELVKALNRDAFIQIEEGFCGGPKEAKTAEGRNRHVLLDTFIDTIRSVADQHGLSDANPEAAKALSLRHLMLLFHQIDYKDRKYITWDEFTMFLIDDAKKGQRSSSDGNDTGRMDRYQESATIKQDPVGRIRYIRYIPEWEKVLRLTSFNEEHTVEVAKVLGNRSFEVTKVSPGTSFSSTAAEAITDHNIIVTSNSDISCSFYSTQSSVEEVAATSLLHHRTVGMNELQESHVSMLWHRGLPEKRFFTGTRSGGLVPWNLHMERNLVSERYKPINELKWQVFGDRNKQAITCLLPWEDKVVCGSMASTRNIAVLDVEKQVAMAPCGKELAAPETLRADEIKDGHKLGVLALARNDYSDVVVSAGFERVPFVWILKLQNFQPWKLLDKHDPHRGDINGLFSPPNTPQIISSDTKGVIKIWDIRTFHCVQTLYSDKKRTDRVESEREANLFYSSVTYNPHGGSLLSCSPNHTTVFRGDVPKYLRCAHDSPVTACLYNVATRNFVTAHGKSVKVWEEDGGSVIAHYENLTDATITCMVLDHRGRKFFVGDARGNVQGHVFATGIKYRSFKCIGVSVADLSYSVFRSGKRFLLVCGGAEFWACDDTEADGKQTKITQPYHLFRAELIKQQGEGKAVTPPMRSRMDRHRSTVAESTVSSNPGSVIKGRQQPSHSVAAVHNSLTSGHFAPPALSSAPPHPPSSPPTNTPSINFTKVTSQSKLSIGFITANSFVAGIDIGSMSVIHLFALQAPVVCVTPLGDLPVVAILDQNWMLYVFAIRPSLSAEKLLVTKALVDPDDLHLDPADRSIPSCMTFHQNKRRLYIGDSAGTVTCWDIADFVKMCGLAPASYPMTSIAETVLRKRHELPDQQRARESIKLLRKVDAHTDEVNTIEVVFTNVAVTIITASYDHRVRAWDWSFKDLGDLSQGRVTLSNKTDKMDIKALQEHYHRNGITPFTFIAAEPEDDELSLSDFSDLVLRLLRRSIHRYKARKERASRAALKAGTTVDEQMRKTNPQKKKDNNNNEEAGKKKEADSKKKEDGAAEGKPKKKKRKKVVVRLVHDAEDEEESKTTTTSTDEKKAKKDNTMIDATPTSPSDDQPPALTSIAKPPFSDTKTGSDTIGDSSNMSDEDDEDGPSPRTLMERSRSLRATTNAGSSQHRWDVLTKVDVVEQQVTTTRVTDDQYEESYEPSISTIFDDQRRRTLVNKHRRSMRFGTFLGNGSIRSVKSSVMFANAMSSGGFTNTTTGILNTSTQPLGMSSDGSETYYAPSPPARRPSAEKNTVLREDLPLTMASLYENKIKAEQKKEEEVAKQYKVNLECLTSMRRTMERLVAVEDTSKGEVIKDKESRKRANHFDGAIPPLPKLPQINLARAKERKTMREAADEASRRLFDVTQTSSQGVPAPQTARALMPSRMDPLRSPSSSAPNTLGAQALTARSTDRHTSLPASKSRGYSSSIYNSSHSISFWASAPPK